MEKYLNLSKLSFRPGLKPGAMDILNICLRSA